MIRVCLVDDQTLMRGGLRRLLESVQDVRVAEAGDGEGAVRAGLDHRPDVLLGAVRATALGQAVPCPLLGEHARAPGSGRDKSR